jgi:NADH-quinone oxidoreductase subunit M
MGGLWNNMPKMGVMGMLFAMASLGLPGLGSFIAEFLILLGAYKANSWLTIIATLGLIFSAIYSLRIMQKVFFGPVKKSSSVKDLTWREMSIMASLTISIIWLGVYPQPLINTAKPMVQQLETIFSKKNMEAAQQRQHLLKTTEIKRNGVKKETYVNE